ncbi:MAG TPA: M13 family metallopeptidase N-terminal domain-containing protein, partial [Oleiagrimonas sp.]|nr:M13 family metallopeptidase N-terminal domain-containing protein [Oleiagrimonas sp.]
MQTHRWILATAIVCALGACSSQSNNPADQAAADSSTATPSSTPARATSSKPSIGVDLAAMDRSVKPGNNFYMYANGTWYKNTEIPADRSSVGTFLTVYKRTQKRITDIIQHAADSNPEPGTNAARIADYYAAYMNTQAIEKHGLKPLKPKLDAIHAIDSRTDLATVLGNRLRQDVDPVNYTDFHTQHLFGLFVAQGLTDPSHNIAYLLQGGLTMPSRDYYLSDNDTMEKYRKAYKDYIENIFKAAGIKNADDAADNVYDLEMKIAKAQESLIDSQNVHKANNLWKLADFSQKAPGMDWDTYFKAAGLSDQKVIDAWQPEAIAKLSKLVADAPLESWKDLLTFHTLDHYAPLLPKKF